MLVGGLLFLLVGGAMVVGAVVSAIRQAQRRALMHRAQGTVVRMVYTMRNMQAPVVAFSGPGGPVEFQSEIGSSPPAFRVGEAVTVLYDPAAPTKAQLDSFWDKWLLPGVLGFIGAVFGFLGLVFSVIGALVPQQ